MTITHNGRPEGTAAMMQVGASIIAYVSVNPDWAHAMVAAHPDTSTPEFKSLYRKMVDDLYGHPDRERGAELAWQLHDAVKAHLADKAWLRRYPRGDGAVAQAINSERAARRLPPAGGWPDRNVPIGFLVGER